MITKRFFGKMSDGREVSCWTLTNEKGLSAEVLDYGVILRSIIVPDKNGQPTDIVLGYDTLEEYEKDDCYLGALIGRFANRIRDARFELNGKNYVLHANDGKNHLHGGICGFNRFIWSSKQEGNKVVFSRISPDGEEGYPGNLKIYVTIEWNENQLVLTYDAESDQDTVINVTSHGYFNLNGAGEGTIYDHLLTLHSNEYTENQEDGIPTGRICSVEHTAMDFRTQKPMGYGYDINMIVSGHPIAEAIGDQSGISLIIDSDQPGVQFYTSNALSPRQGKAGKSYGPHSAFCLETQHYPDSVNHPEWPTCMLRSGEKFHSVTTYTF